MTKVKTWLATVTVLALTAAAPAHASITFEGGWTIGDLNIADPGLVVEVDPDSGTFSETLEVGEHAMFFLFDLWTEEDDVGGDDEVLQSITVDFSLTAPPSSGTVGGTTSGFSHPFFGIVQNGVLDWNNPTSFSFGPGGSGQYSISLTEGKFNKGLFGLKDGQGNGIEVFAKLTYDVAPVPIPPAFALGALALGGLGFYGRRQRHVARV
jgi:hypothetical protein